MWLLLMSHAAVGVELLQLHVAMSNIDQVPEKFGDCDCND